MAEILNGRALAKSVRDKVKTMVERLPGPPGMAAILVGDDPASHLYVSLKERACHAAGIKFWKFEFPTDTDEQTLVAKIQELNQQEAVHGILVQVPLPNHNESDVLKHIDPLKDVDGFHEQNLSKLESGEPSLVPPVALGVMKLIDQATKDPNGMHATLVCSELFGRPLVALLNDRGVESTIVHPDDKALATRTETADIVIIAVGRANFLQEGHIKPGAILIDVGTNRTTDGLVGDVDVTSVDAKAGFRSPVPGGVGPLTVAMLLLNVVKAYQMQRRLQD